MASELNSSNNRAGSAKEQIKNSSCSSDPLTERNEASLGSEQASGNHSNEVIRLHREHPSPNKNAGFTTADKKIIATEGLTLTDCLLNAPRGEAIEIDRPKDLIRNIDLGTIGTK